jgi:hypothetical protein
VKTGIAHTIGDVEDDLYSFIGFEMEFDSLGHVGYG